MKYFLINFYEKYYFIILKYFNCFFKISVKDHVKIRSEFCSYCPVSRSIYYEYWEKMYYDNNLLLIASVALNTCSPGPAAYNLATVNKKHKGINMNGKDKKNIDIVKNVPSVGTYDIKSSLVF
jgi:hypothetical protein